MAHKQFYAQKNDIPIYKKIAFRVSHPVYFEILYDVSFNLFLSFKVNKEQLHLNLKLNLKLNHKYVMCQVALEKTSLEKISILNLVTKVRVKQLKRE